jgi:hypothetical protein
MWSACRWERQTLVVASTGSRSDAKLASAPEPRSKKKFLRCVADLDQERP